MSGDSGGSSELCVCGGGGWSGVFEWGSQIV